MTYLDSISSITKLKSKNCNNKLIRFIVAKTSLLKIKLFIREMKNVINISAQQQQQQQSSRGDSPGIA